MNYQPEIYVEEAGYIYTLRVHLNIAATIASYDTDTNSILVIGSELDEADIGIYEIAFVGTFLRVDEEGKNEVIRYEASMFITVYDSYVPPSP